jgi:hypothetical protein
MRLHVGARNRLQRAVSVIDSDEMSQDALVACFEREFAIEISKVEANVDRLLVHLAAVNALVFAGVNFDPLRVAHLELSLSILPSVDQNAWLNTILWRMISSACVCLKPRFEAAACFFRLVSIFDGRRIVRGEYSVVEFVARDEYGFGLPPSSTFHLTEE